MLSLIKSQALDRIAEITACPKPSYTVDGQSVSWTEYLARLQALVTWCDAQAAGDDPVEVRSQGITL